MEPPQTIILNRSLYVGTQTTCHEALSRAHVLLPGLAGTRALCGSDRTSEDAKLHRRLIRWHPKGPAALPIGIR